MKRCSSIAKSMLRLADPLPRLRPSTAMAAAALLCALAGCLSGPAEPGEPRQVRTSFTFAAVSWESYGMFVSLDEDPEARGQFAGAITFSGDGVVRIRPATANMSSKGALQLSPDELLELYFAVGWDTIELRLKDQDGDGVLESGTGHIVGHTAGADPFEDDFTASADAIPVTATAFRAWSPLDEMAPWESLVLSFGQPVSSDQIPRYRVLANGQEVPGKTEPLASSGELHTGARFVPDGFLPLGATIEVELDGMENALGVPVTLEHEPIEVLADPGSILSNLGFEQALTGWYAAGDTVVVTGAGDLAPVEGASMAALRSEIGLTGTIDSRLVGYLDVPMDATALDLSLALLTPEESLPKLVEIRLYHDLAAGGHEVIDAYELDHESAVLEPCACAELNAAPPLTRRTAPFQRQIDLSKLRGERVFLEIQLDGELYDTWNALAVPPLTPPPTGPAILLVDDLQIR